MRTALDSSVILDVVTEDPRWAQASEAAILSAMRVGQLIVSECVIAEITPPLGPDQVTRLLASWNARIEPSTLESSLEAGAMFARYLNRRHPPRRVLADFLIGAHAKWHAGRLLARDRGYYRDYFAGLTVINPSLPGPTAR
jgi:predicted nucleic acid-binding protein